MCRGYDDSLYYGILARQCTAAIMATQYHMLPVNDIKFGLNRLIIGDTFGIGTFDNAKYAVRQDYLSLFSHLIITYDIDFCLRRYYGYTVEDVFIKLYVADFDNALLAELAALEIVAYRNCRLEILNAQYPHGLEQHRAGDMVYHRAVAQSRHCKRFF